MDNPAPEKRRKSAGKESAKMSTKRVSPKKKPSIVQPEPGLVDQVRSIAGRAFDAGSATLAANRTLKTAGQVAKSLRDGQALKAAGTVLKAMLPTLGESPDGAKTGAALRKLREAAGLTIAEVSAAINLKDPSLIEALENGRLALSFELILRLAAVLGRNDPIGFVTKYTRSANPELWNSLEALGVGKLLLQSAREREFANIYRANDLARSLGDKEFIAVLDFTRSAFETAMTFRGEMQNPVDDNNSHVRSRTKAPAQK